MSVRSKLSACALAAIVCALVAAAPAAAHPRHVARMSSVQIAGLQSQVAAELPVATSEVQQAASAGTSAFNALVQRVAAMPLAAPDTTTPEQYAMLQALQPYYRVTETASVVGGSSLAIPPPAIPATGGSSGVESSNVRLLHLPAAHAASSCWYEGSHISDRVNYSIGPLAAGWFEKDHGYWCGNGSSITSNGVDGFYHNGPVTSIPGDCQVTINSDNGWDGPNSSWAHGRYTTHFGQYTPWTTCVTFMGGSAYLRIAGNGYWDRYNDWG